MTITKTQDGSSLALALAGRLDTTTAPQLEAELKQSVNGVTELTLDFGELEYLSSAGLRVLLSAQKVMNKQTGSYLFLNIAVNRFLMQLLKLTFCVYRPWIRYPNIVPVETASGYSFPSGHSVTSASNYGTVLARYGKKHRPLGVFMIVMLLLTMFSRNYIGVHTPQDVAVGAILGLVVVFLGIRAWEWIDEKPGRERIIPIAGVVLTALFLVYISLKSYPMNYDEAGKLLVDPAKMMKDGYKDAGRILGVSLGWYLERRYVRFSTDVPVLTKVTRCGVGALLLMLYELAFMPAVTGAVSVGWIGFVLTFGELILLMTVYPLCFSRLEAVCGRNRGRQTA